MFDHVVVGVDFSEASRIALKRGAELAEQLLLPFTAVHVVDMPMYLAMPPYAVTADPGWLQDLSPKMEELLREWTAPYPGVKAVVRTGNPAGILMEEAASKGLLVVGQVGHSKIDHLLFGSTAAKVARHASCDVLLVRAAQKA